MVGFNGLSYRPIKGLPEMGAAYTGRTRNTIIGTASGTQVPGFHQFAIFIKELVQFFEVLHSHR